MVEAAAKQQILGTPASTPPGGELPRERKHCDIPVYLWQCFCLWVAGNRIYVGNLFYELTESDLILAFSAFGPIQKLDMPKVHIPICILYITVSGTCM